MVQEPLTSLADDVAATKRVLDLQQGPAILVGHSYGGVVITEAGNAPNVVGLVYIAAFIPDLGESAVSLLSRPPPPTTTSAPPKTTSCTSIRPPSLPISQLTFRPPRRSSWRIPRRCWPRRAGGAPVTTAAWHQKKSWALVATHDHNINPDLERSMAKRAGSKTIEVPGSHAVYVSKPKDVARLIERAAQASGQ